MTNEGDQIKEANEYVALYVQTLLRQYNMQDLVYQMWQDLTRKKTYAQIVWVRECHGAIEELLIKKFMEAENAKKEDAMLFRE